jgi:V/A-type H+-transporting ATPase subunit A
MKLETARSIREDYLHQDAYHEVDTYSALERQYCVMKLILAYYDMSAKALDKGIHINKLILLPVRERIGRFKYIEENRVKPEYEAIFTQLQKEISDLEKEVE